MNNKNTQDTIKHLESLSFLPSIDFADMLLVADGTKPSMFTGLQTNLHSTRLDIEDFDIEECREITAACSGLDLSCETRDDEVKIHTKSGIHYGRRRLYFIAPSNETAEQLMLAHAAGNDLQLGRLLGYPESAINSYIDGTCKNVSDLPTSSRDVSSDQMKLLNHMISADGWEDEVRYLKFYAERLIALSPTLYQKCISLD